MKTIQKLYENKQLKFDDLSDVKQELKQRINEQQEQLMTSAKRIVPFTKDSTTINLNSKSLSPLSLFSTPRRKGNAISLIEGVITGYKMMRNVKKIFFK